MEQKKTMTVLEEMQGLDPAQKTDIRFQKLNTLLRIKSDDDLFRFINKNLPPVRTNDKQELLKHFQKYLRIHYTEEILKYYDRPFTNRALQVNHYKNRLTAYKLTLEKQKHNNSYEYFHVLLEELSFIEHLISRTETKNTPEILPQSHVTANKTKKSTTERMGNSIEQTVFGLNFDFIGRLYENLWSKKFIDESCTKDVFLQHFFIDTIPETRIRLIGKNQSDIGLLINSLRDFFKEDYQDSMFFNSFWAERFEFQTNGDPQNPKTKTPNGISKIISDVKTGNRKSTKINAINEIVGNLQNIPQ
ncbi:hypothetical protein [Chryseobacterium sp. WLY505]|uniref:hypothetical protein n=1 Tax=Chryseobacterium sp. WLY505 TaxID=3068892 RepID=UPI002796AEAB|nr:hypothetical protein [Chryseobacterium sp. WLY505]MDQ1855797.1 hypothetical protein [Chryseobacterium sp. WLY505]